MVVNRHVTMQLTSNLLTILLFMTMGLTVSSDANQQQVTDTPTHDNGTQDNYYEYTETYTISESLLDLMQELENNSYISPQALLYLSIPLTEWPLEAIIEYYPKVQLLICNPKCIGLSNVTYLPDKSHVNGYGFKCVDCFCDDECNMYADCCSLDKKKPPITSSPFKCIDQIESVRMDKAILLKRQCLENYTNGYVRELCTTLQTMCRSLPVTSLSGISYINQHCAVCNNETDFEQWPLNVDYSGFEFIPGTLKDDVMDIFNCQRSMIYEVPSNLSIMDLKLRQCDNSLPEHMVRECNVSGKWVEYNSILASNCRYHYNPIYLSDQNILFQNIFCYLCNGFTITARMQAAGGSAGDLIGITRYVVGTGAYLPEDPVDKHCNTSMVFYHPFQKLCKKIICSDGLKLENETCVPVDGDQEKIVYLVMEVNNNTVSMDLQKLVANVENDLRQLMITRYVASIGIAAKRNSTGNIYLNVFCHSQLNTAFKMFSYITNNWTFGKQVTSTVLSQYQNWKNLHRVVSADVTTACCKRKLTQKIHESTDSIIELTEQYICPHISHYQDEFEPGGNGTKVLLNTSLILKDGDYDIDAHNFTRICLHTIKEKFNQEVLQTMALANPSYFQRILFIVRITFMTLSLVSLLLTFITYCTFPALRSLPAKNNMALVVSMFLAQLLQLSGSFLTKPNTPACAVIGVAIHYIWLCVVFWMNICSYHMFSVFRSSSLLSASSTAHNRRMIKHAVYANGVPVMIVVVVMVTSKATSGSLGYGGDICYLSTPFLVGLAMVLPLSLIIVCNLALLSITIWSISKASNIARQTGKDRHHVIVYIKLSTLTGLTWTLDILSHVFFQQTLQVLSTVLNYGQGIFIFLSYMANRRVLNLWLGLSGRKLPETSKTSSTSNTNTTHI